MPRTIIPALFSGPFFIIIKGTLLAPYAPFSLHFSLRSSHKKRKRTYTQLDQYKSSQQWIFIINPQNLTLPTSRLYFEVLFDL